ncbi:hypothetical protein ACOSQ4_022332 [Xanthoceras sorbifolium]
MASNESKKGIGGGGGFFASVISGLSNFDSAMTKLVNGLLGYEGLEVINPEGSTKDSEEEAKRGRWKQEEREGYWKMMQKYIGSDIQSMLDSFCLWLHLSRIESSRASLLRVVFSFMFQWLFGE